MGQALYRKYRSKKLSEIVGQEHITDTLSNALKSGRISHAYLFTGPRGTGKTSIARILAHEVNGLPYTDDSTHLDIIEIDAASNRRIDEIRDLRDRVHVAPTSAKYKVYIIDEVHMLTREAFNALLKTLEEPPEHAIFILATTEAHKLPETIISRTQRYTFKPVEVSKVVAHLKSIAEQEGVKVSDDALELIARHGEGSFRDSISLLDQARGIKKSIALEDVQALLGIAPKQLVEQLLNTAIGGTPAELVETLRTMRSQGYQAARVAKQLGEALRNEIVTHSSVVQSATALHLLKQLLNVPSAPDPASLLELVLLEVNLAQGPAVPSDVTKPRVAEAKIAGVKPTAIDQAVREAKPKPEPDTAPAQLPETDSELWNQVLSTLKKRHNTLYGVLRMAEPVFGDGVLTLKCRFAFHQKQLNEAKNQKVITDIIQSAAGTPLVVTTVVEKNLTAATTIAAEVPSTSKPVTNDALKSVSDIFGSVEMLE